MLGVMCYVILLFVVTGQRNEIHSDIMQATYNILLIAVVRFELLSLMRYLKSNIFMG